MKRLCHARGVAHSLGALWLHRIGCAMVLLSGLAAGMPHMAHADDDYLGIEQHYGDGYDESDYYGAPWYNQGQEQWDPWYNRRNDGGSYYDDRPSAAEERRAAERDAQRKAAEQQENRRKQAAREAAEAQARAAQNEVFCQQQLPALTDAVRIHRESYELLKSHVRYNADAAMAAYTDETFADTYGAIAEAAEQVQAAEAAFAAQLDASAVLAPPLAPEQVEALGMAVQGVPFETQPTIEGWNALVATSVQHQEVTRQVATLPTHVQERTALLDGAALFIAGADQSFAGADAPTGYALLGVAQEGLDMALTLAAFTPAGATFNVARTLAEYVSGYDFITGAPIDFDTVETVGMAMTLFPGGKVARQEGRLGTTARRMWGRLTGFKGKNTGPEIVRDLETMSKTANFRFEEFRSAQARFRELLLKHQNPADLPLDVRARANASLDELYKFGETRAGLKLKAHGRRTGSAFPKIKGTPEKLNAQGKAMAKEILEHPNSSYDVPFTEGRGNPYIEVLHPDGRGVRLKLDGSFETFLEPAAE